MKRTILFLSGGSLVGYNLLQGLEGRRSNLRLIATNSTADEPILAMYDKVYLAPKTAEAPGETLQLFQYILEKEKPNLVIPCRDYDVFWLANQVEKNAILRPIALVGHTTIAEVFLDKWKSALFSMEQDLPFAPTLRPGARGHEVSLFVEKYGFPLLAKPRTGFASLGVNLIFSYAQLRQQLKNEQVIVQKYLGSKVRAMEYIQSIKKNILPIFHSLEEDKISVQGLIGKNGKLLEVFCTKHQMRNGVSVVVEKLNDALILQRSEEWLSKFAMFGWRGPINIQCQFTPDGKLFIYEFNGRFTGATAARVQLGFDEIGLLLNDFISESIEVPPGSDIEKVVRKPTSMAIDSVQVTIIKPLA